MEITVKELIEKLKQFPENYRVVFKIIEYQDSSDIGDCFRLILAEDFDSIKSNEYDKSITIESYE